MDIIEVKKEIAKKIEEDNRNDVVNFVKEIAVNILGVEVNDDKAAKVASEWFEIHKNHVDEFAVELMEFGDEVVKMVVNNRNDWTK